MEKARKDKLWKVVFGVLMIVFGVPMLFSGIEMKTMSGFILVVIGAFVLIKNFKKAGKVDNQGLKLMLFFMAVSAVMSAHAAFAMTAPSSTDFGYGAYDWFVNHFLEGPIGHIAADAAMLFGAYEGILKGRHGLGAGAFLAGYLGINADALTTSFGLIR